MNKQKTLTIIERLENIIQSKKETHEYEIAKIYINSWVIGTLEEIKTKIIGVDVPYMVKHNTYARLFQEFIGIYFCTRIDPKIKIYTIAVLFDFDTRDLIIDLYKQLFNKKQRDNDSTLRGYIEFNQLTKESQFEVIRHNYARMGAC